MSNQRYMTLGVLVIALAFISGAQADCLYNCNTTYTQCQQNPYVDYNVCQNGMQSCVFRCLNYTQNSSDTWASNCTNMISYCQYFDNSTCRSVITDCMWRAFQPKYNQWWSPYECTYQCNDASQLCSYNYSQYVDYWQCKNATDQCYYNCFQYDYDNWNWSNNSNNSNWTNGTYWALSSSPKPKKEAARMLNHSPVKSVPCTACQWVAGKVEGMIAKHGCNWLFKAEVTAACETALGGPEDPLADACALAFIGACSYFAGQIQKHAFSPKSACSHLHMCWTWNCVIHWKINLNPIKSDQNKLTRMLPYLSIWW